MLSHSISILNYTKLNIAKLMNPYYSNKYFKTLYLIFNYQNITHYNKDIYSIHYLNSQILFAYFYTLIISLFHPIQLTSL